MASEPTATIPDFMALIPESRAKRVIEYCINDMGLSVSEAERVIYDASKLVSCVDFLLMGGVTRDKS